MPIIYTNDGVATFIELSDTPSAYTDQAGKYMKVNTGETALEFTDAPSGGGADILEIQVFT